MVKKIFYNFTFKHLFIKTYVHKGWISNGSYFDQAFFPCSVVFLAWNPLKNVFFFELCIFFLSLVSVRPCSYRYNRHLTAPLNPVKMYVWLDRSHQDKEHPCPTLHLMIQNLHGNQGDQSVKHRENRVTVLHVESKQKVWRAIGHTRTKQHTYPYMIQHHQTINI